MQATRLEKLEFRKQLASAVEQLARRVKKEDKQFGFGNPSRECAVGTNHLWPADL